MTTLHLSEMEIQQYAADRAHCAPAIVQHVADCGKCRDAAALYESMFKEIGLQPGPRFDFDLTALVMPQIAKPAVRPFSRVQVIALATMIVAGSIGIPVWLFRAYFLKMVPGLLSGTVYLALLPIITIVVFQCLEIFKRYQNQLKALNY